MPLVKEIETLSRLHAEGILTAAEFAAAKQAILDEVPEANAPEKAPQNREALCLLFACALPPVLAATLVFALGIPAMLSLTLGVTILAAILIARFRETEG